MSYTHRIKKHLAQYKEDMLEVTDSGSWRNKKRPHILPEALWKLNILEEIRPLLLSYLKSHLKIERHKGFHHLNSSQAACFNLFFPLLTRDSWTTPTKLFPIDFGSIKKWQFEYVADSAEGTNFDLWVLNEDDHQLFVEFKLTENGFGSARDDDHHRKKLNKIYKPRLQNKIAPEFLEPSEFFQHYQLFRNLSYADPATHASVVFLIPRENSKLEPSLSKILLALTPETQSVVSVCYLEDFVNTLVADKSNSAMSSYFAQYANKYLPENH